ncbi:MAG: phosphoribosylamine--glycine ligase [Candidatus Dormibacteraeota bacterium]|nr:phosphoribosylamine--glycine ligase [Candidatus Dormibacteraeota bacterium]
MKVLVLGSGAREHALLWMCQRSTVVDKVMAAPGNGATQAVGAHITIDPQDPADVLAAVHEYDIDLTVIGPDDAVAAGVADHLGKAGRHVFGPTAAAGRIESSKSFAKEVMLAAGVRTPAYRAFDDVNIARDYVRRINQPMVVKADGLALGKGVVVCSTVAETLRAIDRAMVDDAFGAAGARVILEERLEGPEVSLMCLCDGERAVPMAPARDYKRAGDGDQGPNTGGMGAYSPPSDVDDEMTARIVRDCAQPVVTELAARGTPYHGCLYTQVMLTAEGPMVIEFNARFGDPEAQVVLPRLNGDLVELMVACTEGDISRAPLSWRPLATAGVVLASRGYPGKYDTGLPIEGLDTLDDNVIAFHAGTRHTTKGYITSGGRVLTIVALGDTVADARRRAYDNAARVTFDGVFYRSDIAAQELASTV